MADTIVICTPEAWPVIVGTPGRLADIQQWLRANSIDPRVVAIADLTVTTGTIRYTAYVTTADGNKQVDPNDRTKAWAEERTAPCVVDPPPGLRLPEEGSA